MRWNATLPRASFKLMMLQMRGILPHYHDLDLGSWFCAWYVLDALCLTLSFPPFFPSPPRQRRRQTWATGWVFCCHRQGLRPTQRSWRMIMSMLRESPVLSMQPRLPYSKILTSAFFKGHCNVCSQGIKWDMYVFVCVSLAWCRGGIQSQTPT